jgi:hypothetical protein
MRNCIFCILVRRTYDFLMDFENRRYRNFELIVFWLAWICNAHMLTFRHAVSLLVSSLRSPLRARAGGMRFG